MVTTFRTVALIALALACFSCDPAKPAADANVQFASPATGGKPGAVAGGMPDIPKDAQYTIVCRSFTEDTHVDDSRRAQQMLMDSTNMKKWYVVHAADHSTLYYGFYRCINPHDPGDGAEGQRAINDQNTIRAMTTTDGQRLFSECLLVGVDAPDPEANLAWDITKTTGTWSIEIASFKGTSDRKQRAVEAVKEARAEGIEAYYYHGPTASSVCIGCWPADAAVEVSTDVQNTDPDKPLYVTPEPLDPTVAAPLAQKGVQSVAPHVDILDPTLTRTLAKYPYHATNGQNRAVADPVTQEQKIVERSFMFKIPHRDPMDDNADDHLRAAQPAPTAAPPTPVQDPDLGHLRSLGE